MEEITEVPNEGILSATSSLHEDPSSNNQSYNGWMGIMSAEDMEVLSADDNKAFCMAVSLGNVKRARSMLDQKPGLARIKIQNGMLPIHMAASCGHHQMLRFFFRQTKLDDLDLEQKVHLFFTTLKNSIFDVAYLMLKKCPTLADSRDEEQLTALHVLARKPPEKFSRRQIGRLRMNLDTMIRALWMAAKSMERNEMLELISRPSGVLFDAAKSGNATILKLFLKSHPELLMAMDSTKRNLFHIAVLYRQETILIHMIENGIFKDLIMQAVDEDRNNILHMAGMLPPHERFGSSRPDVQMQRELLWFKEVESRVPTALKTMENRDGKTPKEIFYREHGELSCKGKTAVKDTANYGMLVATIIATIVFAASLAVPGHDVSPGRTYSPGRRPYSPGPSPSPNSSTPSEEGWFITYVLSNAVALFSSSSSIICFLSVLTSSFREDEFISLLQRRLLLGVITLFVAITTMMVAFTAACFLIFNHRSAWVTTLVAFLCFFTVGLFLSLLCTLFGDLIRSVYWSRHLFHSTNYFHRRLKRGLVTTTGLVIGLTILFVIFRHLTSGLFLGVPVWAFLVWPLLTLSVHLIPLFHHRLFLPVISYTVLGWDLMCQNMKSSQHHQENKPVVVEV